MNTKKVSFYISLMFLTATLIFSINQAKSYAIVPGPSDYYYGWVYDHTQTVVDHEDISGDPLYLQFLLRPEIRGLAVATERVSTSITEHLSTELGISVTLAATVKELAAKSTAKASGGITLTTDATISTTMTEGYRISVSNISSHFGRFTARTYTLTISVYAKHYYLHKYVWDWHTSSYYDEGPTTEQNPYHKVEYWLEVYDLKNPLTLDGVYIDAKDTQGNYKYPDAMNIYEDIINNHDYIDDTEYIRFGPYDPKSNETPPSHDITIGKAYSYSFSTSVFVSTELGEGIEVLGDKLEVSTKFSASSTLGLNNEYSEVRISYFEYWGTVEGECYFNTLAWNGLWVEAI